MSRTSIGAALLLTALGLVVYGNALRNPFVIDDKEIILRDVRVLQGHYAELAKGRYWPPPRKEMLYRPLVKVSYALNWAASHEAWSFRVPNLLMHVAASFVLFLLARDMFRSIGAAIVAAAIFVIHPIHTEPLNAVVGRADIAATLFGLLSLWLYWRDDGPPARPGRLRPILAAACFVAAVSCKESALPLVGVVMLLDTVRSKLQQQSRPSGWLPRRVLRCYAPLLLLVILYLTVRTEVLGGVVRGSDRIGLIDNVIAHPDHDLNPGDSAWLARWGTPVVTFGKSVGLMLWPRPLSWDYSYAAIETVKRFSDPRLLWGLACAAGFAVLLVVSYRCRCIGFVSLGFWLLTYSVVSNTVVLIGTAFAERLLYLPSAGFCLLAGGVLGTAIERKRRATGVGQRTLATGAALVLLVGGGSYGWWTIDRNRDWRSAEVLIATDVRTNPRSTRLQSAVAARALDQEDFDTALAHAEQAIAISPENPGGWRVKGLVHWGHGDHDQALRCLAKSFVLGGAGNEFAMLVAAEILTSQNQYGEAIRLLNEFVGKYPLAAESRNNLAWYLLTAEPVELRDPQAALTYVRSALNLRPHEAPVIDTYASALIALNRPEEAVQVLRDALRKVPRDDPMYADLLKKLRTLENP